LLGTITSGCDIRLARVRHLTRVKIIESNNVVTRPGSIYDNITYFESIFDAIKPHFYYEFIDTGLGTAEPLYPMLQAGYQGSWLQLLPAFLSEKARHIDHFTSLPTPEGCQVYSSYMLRYIDEFPPEMYQVEREEAYDLIVVRLEYYEKKTPSAECGRHLGNDYDPNFDPIAWLKSNLDAKSLADFPQEELSRFEAKVSAIRHIEQRFIKGKEMPRFDPKSLQHNSLWYYPNGQESDYGINYSRPQEEPWPHILYPRQLVVPADANLQKNFPLSRLLSKESYDRVLNMMLAKPTEDFDPSNEPGKDALNIEQVDNRYMYTFGVHWRPIQNAYSDVSTKQNFRLVGFTIRPYQWEDDIEFEASKIIPQVRLVYQLMDPTSPDRPLEQLYYHLNFDAVDRLTDDESLNEQHLYFMDRLEALTAAREEQDDDYPLLLQDFLAEFTQRPVENISFSSSLSGIWIFGALTTTNNPERELKPVRIVREGVDVGYYSSAFDNDLFRQAMASTSGQGKEDLKMHLDDQTVSHYRDPKRMNVEAINFDRMTCAQCHQMSGRDAVHMAINDGIDSRFIEPIRTSEFVYHELDAQLQLGSKGWEHP